MTEDENRSAYVPWGERPTPPSQPAWWAELMSVPALLAHLVVMLAVSSVLTVINLLAGPRIWWSLALLVIWLAFVIIHAIGVASRTLLFVEDEAESVSATRGRAEPHGPAVPGWLSLPRRAARAPEQEPMVPETWELKDDEIVWPGPPVPDSPLRRKPASDAAAVGETPPAPAATEKVPWRAATDIAWLRRPKPDAAGDTDSPPDRTASS